jgi:hypothetical protein
MQVETTFLQIHDSFEAGMNYVRLGTILPFTLHQLNGKVKNSKLSIIIF